MTYEEIMHNVECDLQRALSIICIFFLLKTRFHLYPRNHNLNTFSTVTIGISKEVLKSNVVGRGKSYAASVKDETTKTHRIRKSIPKKERRAMIVSFVEKYIS